MSATFNERMARQDKFSRTIKTTKTYLKKAQAWLYNDPPNMVEYWDLLDATIQTATEIIERLPEDFFQSEEVVDYFGLRAAIFPGGLLGKMNSSDAPLEAARALVTMIEKRRERGDAMEKIRRLEAVEGRTPEEAEVYLAKARELRERL